MSVILSTIRDLARTLGCGIHQAETVVREEQSARVALSRRGLFKAAGAIALGTVVSAPEPSELVCLWRVVGNPGWDIYAKHADLMKQMLRITILGQGVDISSSWELSP